MISKIDLSNPDGLHDPARWRSPGRRSPVAAFNMMSRVRQSPKRQSLALLLLIRTSTGHDAHDAAGGMRKQLPPGPSPPWVEFLPALPQFRVKFKFTDQSAVSSSNAPSDNVQGPTPDLCMSNRYCLRPLYTPTSLRARAVCNTYNCRRRPELLIA